jgi:hypothetical protein
LAVLALYDRTRSVIHHNRRFEELDLRLTAIDLFDLVTERLSMPLSRMGPLFPQVHAASHTISGVDQIVLPD